jgi:UDP-N-acetyl-D-glucosamine dehydrogenase
MSLVELAEEKFRQHSAVVGVVGLGYAGLPVAFAFAEAGYKVIGFDIDEAKVEALNSGHSYIPHLPVVRIRALLDKGTFRASCNFAELTNCDAVLICVPTPLDEFRAPDLSSVINTTQSVARFLQRGQLIVLESTTYPGTTHEVVLPILKESGLKVGEDFFLAFSPEREDPGNAEFSVKNIPKLVGGITSDCLAVACAAYREIVGHVVPVSSTRVAEASKLLENTFRCINVAMVNELKVVFDKMGIDIWEVIDAASTKPFGFVRFSPGPGLGGHCIPIDPFYLSWKSRQYGVIPHLIELAGKINSAMPKYVVNRLIEGLKSNGKSIRNSNVLVVGVAYKRDIDDVRESPALAIMNLLRAEGAEIKYHDPYVPILRSRYLPGPMLSVELTSNTIADADAVVIVTDHREIDYHLIVQSAKLVIDTRNATAAYRNSGCLVINA